MGYSRTINRVWDLVPAQYLREPREKQAAWVADYLSAIRHWDALEEHLEWEAQLDQGACDG